MSDTDDNDPYRPKQPDPNEPPPPPPPPPPPASPQWGSIPPASGDQPGQGTPEGQWTSGQPGQYGQPQYGQPQYGQPQYGQPQYGQPQYGQPAGPPPANYLVWAILSTLFCCLPLGVVSIVFAAQVNSKYAAGDVAGALESSRKAKSFAIWSAGVAVVLGVVYAVAIVLIAGASASPS